MVTTTTIPLAMSYSRGSLIKNGQDIPIANLISLRDLENSNVYLKQYNIPLCHSTPIFRYERLSYLIDMIINKRMYLPSIKKFSDLIEKQGLKKYKQPPRITPARESYNNRRWINRQDKEMNDILSCCAKCWTMDTRCDGSIGESMLMWRTYASHEIVCRIGTTIERLSKCISYSPCDLIIADVNYGKNEELNHFEQLVFNKTIYYDHEQEVRLLALIPNSEGIYIDIDPSILISEIKTSPFLPPQTAKFVLSQLERIIPNKTKPIMDISSIEEYDDSTVTDNRPDYLKIGR